MGIFKVKDSPYYHFAFTFKGCRYRGSTGFEKRADAETYFENERRRVRLGEIEQDTVTLLDAFDRYEEEHAMFLNSYASTQSHVNHLLGYFGNGKMLHEIDEAAMVKYVADCRKETYRKKTYAPKQGKMIEVGKAKVTSNATINRRISAIQGMHSRATKIWKYKTQPINFNALKLKEKVSIDNTLLYKDVQKLWDAAPVHLRHFIIISLHTGWRMMNVLTLTKEQINLRNHTITTIGKGGKLIVSPITDSFESYIRANELHKLDYPCAYKDKPVSSIKTAWKALFKRAKVKYIRIHDLRHTFGTWLYEQTGDQRLVQEMLHHSDIKTSIRYTHTKRELQRDKLNKAINFEFNQVKAIK